MEQAYLRLECLKLAVSKFFDQPNPKDIVAAAQKYAAFVFSEAVASCGDGELEPITGELNMKIDLDMLK